MSTVQAIKEDVDTHRNSLEADTNHPIQARSNINASQQQRRRRFSVKKISFCSFDHTLCSDDDEEESRAIATVSNLGSGDGDGTGTGTGTGTGSDGDGSAGDGSAGVIADAFDDCTILFVHVCGLRDVFRDVTTTDAVTMLNRIVCRFDDVAERSHILKVKTIGTTYMVSSH